MKVKFIRTQLKNLKKLKKLNKRILLPKKFKKLNLHQPKLKNQDLKEKQGKEGVNNGRYFILT